MRRLGGGGLILTLCALCLMAVLAQSAMALGPSNGTLNVKMTVAPRLSAGAAILMDWRTGQVLFEHDARRRRDPASTTKVLTAILALERGNLSDLVTISRRAAFTPGSSMHVKKGEFYSLHDLLHGLLLRSGNDAAVAIAEHVAGSVEDFALLMTQRAREMGAAQSQFANPHGLTDSRHYSTAYDLAVITRYALMNETFRTIVAQREVPLTFEQQNRDVVLHNTNRLLHSRPEIDGVKTGTTAAAGNCLIASATREEQKLIAVILHAGNRWADADRLLGWGFDSFATTILGQAGEVLWRAPVVGGRVETVGLTLARDLAAVVPRTPQAEPEVRVSLATEIKAPLQRGQTLGRVTVSVNGIVQTEALLTAAEGVPRLTFRDRLYRLWHVLTEF